jgi:coenzyme F420-0:L-glutamate ligase / coenzyme F420-1:gamma-L-glutamate ligase
LRNDVSLNQVTIIGLPPLPEVKPGDDIEAMIIESFERGKITPEASDVLVVTHKVVSKSEGRLVDLNTVLPSTLATEFAGQYGKDPRQVEVAMSEAARIVRMDRGVLITETRQGFTCANSGVDASNVSDNMVCLLPVDPDRSAVQIREAIGFKFGVQPGVIISDSFGRPWRNGIVNVAVGVAGMAPLIDYRGVYDPAGYELHVTVIAIADEIASSAELVMNKLDRRPLALIRNYQPPLHSRQGTGQDLIMDPAKDMFR